MQILRSHARQSSNTSSRKLESALGLSRQFSQNLHLQPWHVRRLRARLTTLDRFSVLLSRETQGVSVYTDSVCAYIRGPDMLIQISCDLDTACFDGRLRYRIRVFWEDVYTTLLLGSDLKKVLAVSDLDEDQNTCHIVLNRYGIQGGLI